MQREREREREAGREGGERERERERERAIKEQITSNAFCPTAEKSNKTNQIKRVS